MIGGTACRLRINAAETQLTKTKRLDKSLDHANRIVLADPVFQAFREQRALTAVRSFNKTLHPIPRANRQGNRSSRRVFTQPGSEIPVPARADPIPLTGAKLTRSA